jgi:hypothetical protein
MRTAAIQMPTTASVTSGRRRTARIFADPPRFDGGILPASSRADMRCMIWPVAALAVFLLGFVVVYGSVLQSRVEAGLTTRGREDSGVDTEIA